MNRRLCYSQYSCSLVLYVLHLPLVLCLFKMRERSEKNNIFFSYYCCWCWYWQCFRCAAHVMADVWCCCCCCSSSSPFFLRLSHFFVNDRVYFALPLKYYYYFKWIRCFAWIFFVFVCMWLFVNTENDVKST